MADQPLVPEAAPPAARLRLRYAKRGRLRFLSHRDVARALERALRRAGLPIAFSAGFHPHPKISYLGAAPTGAASEAEYVELALAEPVAMDRLGELADRLDAALPAGLDILAVAPVRDGDPPLATLVDGSRWRVGLPGVPIDAARAALDRFLQAGAVPVQRLTKSGRRAVDARAAVVDARVVDARVVDGEPDADRHCAILDLVVRHVTPAVRPDDVLAGLRQAAGLAPPEPPRAVRLAQGLLGADGRLADPLPADRPGRSSMITPEPSGVRE